LTPYRAGPKREYALDATFVAIPEPGFGPGLATGLLLLVGLRKGLSPGLR
jgi:hypothetical protein